MKINITPEMRFRMMQAETIEIDVPDTQAEFVGLLRQQDRYFARHPASVVPG